MIDERILRNYTTTEYAVKTIFPLNDGLESSIDGRLIRETMLADCAGIVFTDVGVKKQPGFIYDNND